MAATNDLIYEKLTQEFPAEGASVGDLLARYRGGEQFLRLPGARSTDFVTVAGGTPANSKFDAHNNLWVAADVALDDWTPAAQQTFVAKWLTLFDFKEWYFGILTTGVLRAVYSPDGVTERTFDSTVNLAAQPNGSRLAVGVEIVTNDGGGNRTATFYTAPTIDGPWAQLGAVVSQVGAENMGTEATNLQIGCQQVLANANHMIGNMYAVEIRSGNRNGTLLAKPRFNSLSRPVGNVDLMDEHGNRFVTAPFAGNWQTQPLESSDLTGLAFGTSDLDVRIKVAQADWTHAGVTHWFVHHGNHSAGTPQDLSWAFTIHPDGRLRTAISADGVNFIGPVTTNPVGFVDGSEHFLRTTVDLDDGAGNSVFNYYESFNDGATWVPMTGSPHVEPLGPIVLFNATRPLELQSNSSTTQTTKYLEIRRGIDGPIVVKADFTKAVQGLENFVDETNRSWTFEGSSRAHIVKANGFPKYEDYVANIAAASPSLNVGDDENAFWDAFADGEGFGGGDFGESPFGE